MGRLLALGILGTLACAPVAHAQSIAGTITTTAKGAAPVRVTIDHQVCGQQLPDEAIVVAAQGRLANAVVILTGVKRAAAREVLVTNDKCRFTPRVQVVAPKGSVKTTSNDAVL